MNCPLLSLSPELLLAICDELDVTHLKQLRLTCKAFGYTLAAAPVLRKLTISAKRPLKETVLDLQCLIEAKGITAEATRELKIDLSSFGGPKIRLMQKRAGEMVTTTEENDTRRRIYTAITSLKAVTTLTWRTHVRDPTWLQVTIWRSIKALPNLRHLTIHPAFSECPLDLHALKELESITIFGTPRTGPEKFLDNLAKLCALSPKLTSLEVYHERGRKVLTLHDLFHMRNNKSPPLQLRHLGLHSCSVRLDKVTLWHLRHLTSLNLKSNYVSPGFANSAGEFWRHFIGSGIHLQELKHDFITTSLIDYLSSYSGLKKLRLTVDESDECLAVADPFFNTCLLNHVDTLEELILIAHSVSSWNFCSNNSRGISKCAKLKLLAMTVPLYLGEETQWEFRDDNVVKQFINIALAHMPHMQHLFLAGAWSEISLHPDNHDTANIGECIRKYIPLESCQYLPPVTIFLTELFMSGSASAMFVGRDTGNGLKYTEKAPLSKFQYW